MQTFLVIFNGLKSFKNDFKMAVLINEMQIWWLLGDAVEYRWAGCHSMQDFKKIDRWWTTLLMSKLLENRQRNNFSTTVRERWEMSIQWHFYCIGEHATLFIGRTNKQGWKKFWVDLVKALCDEESPVHPKEMHPLHGAMKARFQILHFPKLLDLAFPIFLANF